MKKWRPVLSWIYFLCFAAYIIYRWNQLSLDTSDYLEWAALLLVPFTAIILIIEARKWILLIGQNLAIWSAIKQVLAGFSTAVFTPGQFGHFVGRKIMHSQMGWTSATGATLLGGFWQTMTFIICGAVALWWIALPDANRMIWIFMRYGSLAAIVLGFTALLLINPLLHFLGDKNWARNKFVRPIVNVTAAMRNRGMAVNLKLFGLSLSKSLIIYAQFSWLIYIGGDQNLPYEAVLMIPVVFLILTLLPLPAMLGLIARGEVVLQLWNMYELNAEQAYVCIYALWAFNVMLPAIAGTVMILVYQRRLNI